MYLVRGPNAMRFIPGRCRSPFPGDYTCLNQQRNPESMPTQIEHRDTSHAPKTKEHAFSTPRTGLLASHLTTKMSYFRVQCPLPLTARSRLLKRKCKDWKGPWVLDRPRFSEHHTRMYSYNAQTSAAYMISRSWDLSWTRLDFGEHFGNQY